jgi:hypothetical protein
MGFQRLVAANTPRLVLEGVREHNLKNVSVEIPLQRLVCVTGVSGSGKSTLVQDVLAPALMRHFGRSTEAPGRHDRLLGAELLADVVFVDQSPIGKTARSNPVSYVGAWDAIRECSPMRRCRASAATPRPSSASTAAMGAARPAAAPVSSMSRCSSSATSTCVARIATASATGPRSSRCASSAPMGGGVAPVTAGR